MARTKALARLPVLLLALVGTGLPYAASPGLASAQATAAQPSCLPHPRIEVRGGCRLRVDPDQVAVTVEATATRRNATQAGEVVANAVAQIKAELESAGFESVVSLSYRGPDLQYKWVDRPGTNANMRVPIGYQIREVLLATGSSGSDVAAAAEDSSSMTANAGAVAASTDAVNPLTQLAQAAAESVKNIAAAAGAEAVPPAPPSPTTPTDPEAAMEEEARATLMPMPISVVVAPAMAFAPDWDPPLPEDGSDPSDPIVSVREVRYGLTPKASAAAALRARQLAAADAQAKADVLSKSMNLTLGQLLYVTDFDSTPITTGAGGGDEAQESSGALMMADSMLGAAAAPPMARRSSAGPGGDPVKKTFHADVSAAFAAE